jgi:hypothetical protein
MMRSFLFCISGVLFLLSSCKKPDYEKVIHDPELYRLTVKKLNDIVLENNFPPVTASRNYAYANIAAYEVIAAGDPDHFRSLSGQIKHLPLAPRPSKDTTVDFQFAALLAFCHVGNAVTFPEGSMDTYVDDLKKKAKDAGMPTDLFNASVNYADKVAKFIMKWSKGDHYAQTRSASKYTVKQQDGRWVPTPPMYAQALEAHWGEIRPMVLDSAAQLIPPDPPPFNVKDKSSTFYKAALEVKQWVDSLTKEQKHQADFWDDNAFKLNVVGHASFATKKFSPGGHWMNITAIATKAKKLDFNSTVGVYTETAIALFDGFINCWYLKYRSNYVRPETVITKYIDSDWRPYIQTPPFPEYSSGHAVISSAAAEVLTSNFGDDFAYTDSSEMEFGIDPLSFKSFREAAKSAAMSRVYGGIHFKNACIVGNEQGKVIGQLVVKKLQFKNGK